MTKNTCIFGDKDFNDPERQKLLRKLKIINDEMGLTIDDELTDELLHEIRRRVKELEDNETD